MTSGFKHRAARLCTIALALLFFPRAALSAFAAQPVVPVSIYYQGPESLVSHRLQLDPSTRSADSLANAQTAVYQDQLPPPGPELEALKARVASGMGLVLILGRDVDPASLKALTDGAVEQTGVVDAPPGPTHAYAAEKLAAIIAYAGPADDPIGVNVSWKSAVRIHERSLLKVSSEVAVLVSTTTADPIRPSTPILLRFRVDKGAIYILNVWITARRITISSASSFSTGFSTR